jgi:hypothetical protein
MAFEVVIELKTTSGVNLQEPSQNLTPFHSALYKITSAVDL